MAMLAEAVEAVVGGDTHRDTHALAMLAPTGIAYLPDDEAAGIIDSAGLPRRTPHTITDREALLAKIKEIMRAGYAVDDEEDAVGIFCVGSGVRDDSGSCVAAISVTGLKAGVSSKRYHEVGRAVRAAADRISAQLGFDEGHARSAHARGSA